MDSEKLKTALATLVAEAAKAPSHDAARFTEAANLVTEALKTGAFGADGPGQIETALADLKQLRTELDELAKQHLALSRRTLMEPLCDGPVPTDRMVRWQFTHPSHARELFDMCRAIKDGDSKQLTPATGPEGGYAVPTGISQGILTIMQTVGRMEQNAMPTPLGPGASRFLRTLTPGQIFWKAPGVAATPTTPTMGFFDMSAETLIGLILVDLELEEDSAIDIGNFVGTLLGYLHAKETDRVLCTGTGIPADGGITGIFASPHVTTVSAAATHTTIALATYADLMSLEPAVWESGLDGAKWLINRYTKYRMKLLVDTAGHPLWQPPSMSEPGTFAGYDHVSCGAVPGTAATGISTGFAAFGNFFAGLRFGRRGPLVLDFSSIPGWTTLQKFWRCYQRCDATVVGFTAAEIAASPDLVNPIAVLATAAA